ncbi:MAG TPA: type II CAAX endopeptidase family protein [Gemmatimonadaceae bacterium]
MSQSDFLYKTPGTLRAPWRLVIFVVAALAAQLILSATVGLMLRTVFAVISAPPDTSGAWVASLSFLAATAFCVKVVDHQSWSEVWLGRDEARTPVLLIGFAVGALAIAVPTAMLILAGWLRNDGGVQGSWLIAMLQITLLLVPAALIEELMMRGYLLAVLRDAWGWKWAIVATSIVFGLLHLFNPGVSVESILLVVLAGFFLAGVLYVTKSLYAAWLAHFAWNWTMAAVFHVAVSGIPMETPNYHYVDAGPDWATGGQWGPEGGLPAALGMGATMVFLYSNKKRREAEAEASVESHS